MKRQAGFTLVELAIVLVVSGLLLAGIIQGSSLISSGAAKNLAKELRTVPIYVYQYDDAFRALPGDDVNASSHVSGTPATTPGTLANRRIEGAWNSTAPTDESFLVWQHLRKAQLATGAVNIADPAYLPRNVSGGRVGISSNVPIVGMTGGYFVCSGAIRGRDVAQIDLALDDGATDKGVVQVALQSDANAPQAAVAAATIDNSQLYNVCMAF